jgi:hypothetical protein
VKALADWLSKDPTGGDEGMPKDPYRIPAPHSAIDLPSRYSQLPDTVLHGCNAKAVWREMVSLLPDAMFYARKWLGPESVFSKPCRAPEDVYAALRGMSMNDLTYINVRRALQWPDDIGQDGWGYVLDVAPKLAPRLYWRNGPRRDDGDLLFGMQHIVALQCAACIVHGLNMHPDNSHLMVCELLNKLKSP